MPLKPMRPCRYPGCPHLTQDKSGYCPQHLTLTRQQADRQRGTSNQRGYNYDWQQYAKFYLRQPEHALCAICLKKNPPEVKAAQCVDHIKPHKGDYDLFWDPLNHQPACFDCHNIKTAKEDGAFGNLVKEKTEG